MLLALLFLRSFGNRLLDTIEVAIDNSGELRAIGKQNEDLWTQNGLLRDQNKTLKGLILTIEDLAYLIKLVEENDESLFDFGPTPKFPDLDGGAKPPPGLRPPRPWDRSPPRQSRDARLTRP